MSADTTSKRPHAGEGEDVPDVPSKRLREGSDSEEEGGADKNVKAFLDSQMEISEGARVFFHLGPGKAEMLVSWILMAFPNAEVEIKFSAHTSTLDDIYKAQRAPTGGSTDPDDTTREKGMSISLVQAERIVHMQIPPDRFLFYRVPREHSITVNIANTFRVLPLRKPHSLRFIVQDRSAAFSIRGEQSAGQPSDDVIDFPVTLCTPKTQLVPSEMFQLEVYSFALQHKQPRVLRDYVNSLSSTANCKYINIKSDGKSFTFTAKADVNTVSESPPRAQIVHNPDRIIVRKLDQDVGSCDVFIPRDVLKSAIIVHGKQNVLVLLGDDVVMFQYDNGSCNVVMSMMDVRVC
jgi:hypothetical protein